MQEQKEVKSEAVVPTATAEKTLDRILANALEHFSNYGYEGASIREITEASHVTKPTLYYYFKNKEELYRGLATSCCEKLLSVLGESVKISGNLSVRFHNLITEYYKLYDENSPLVRFVYFISLTPGRDVPDVGIGAFNRQVTGIVSQLVEDAAQRGELSPERVPAISLLLVGLLTVAMGGRLTQVPVSLDAIQGALDCVLVKGKA